MDPESRPVKGGSVPVGGPKELSEAKAEVVELESILKEAGILATGSVRQLEEFQQSLGVTWSEFQDELRRNAESAQEHGRALAELEKRLTDRIEDLEDELQEKEELLEARDAEIEELRAKIREGDIPSAGAPRGGNGLEPRHAGLFAENRALKEQGKKMSARISELEETLRVQQELSKIGEEAKELKSQADDEAVQADTKFSLKHLLAPIKR